MGILEKIWIKLLGNTKGYDFNLCDWDIMSLREHRMGWKPLSKAESHALIFLEQMGEWMEIWDPSEKWKRPYGEELNEKRKLH